MSELIEDLRGVFRTEQIEKGARTCKKRYNDRFAIEEDGPGSRVWAPWRQVAKGTKRTQSGLKVVDDGEIPSGASST